MHKTAPARLLSLFAVLVLLLSACGTAPTAEKPKACEDAIGCVTLARDEPVVLGAIQSLSGKVATLGQEQMRGFELALARRGGKVAGRTVKLVTEDTGCAPEGGANAALRIVADPKVVALFGTTCSGDAATAAEVMTKAGLSMISGNNSAPFLTSIGGKQAPKWQPGYLRTAPNEESSGPAAARFAYTRLGVRKAATINDGDIYTRGLTDGFVQEFKRLGGEIVLDTAVNKTDTNMGPVLTAVKNAQAQLVFFPLFQPEGNHLLLQARKTPGLDKVVLMSDGSLIDASFIAAVGKAAVGMYFVGPTPPDKTPELEKLEGEYRARFGVVPPTFYYVSAFDAANILFDAIEKAAKPGKPDSATLTIGRQALRDALYATRGHKGVSGTMNCSAYGDCAAQRFNVLRLDDPAAGVEGLKSNVIFTYSPQ